ncbi:MAG: hypothetical protein MK134_02595 [Dehalococcoidia bacterium]|nr:hypothetical protein [Dehalococcoidia bacterium]
MTASAAERLSRDRPQQAYEKPRDATSLVVIVELFCVPYIQSCRVDIVASACIRFFIHID